VTKLTASKGLMWLMELHQHVQQVSIEAMGEKSDVIVAIAWPRLVGIVKLASLLLLRDEEQ
jgi:energy-converting hydrogenase A subunit M